MSKFKTPKKHDLVFLKNKIHGLLPKTPRKMKENANLGFIFLNSSRHDLITQKDGKFSLRCLVYDVINEITTNFEIK